YQVSRAGVQAEQVRVVSFGIDEVLPDRYATILVSCGVVQQSRADGTTVVPQAASRARIQGEDIVGRSYIHDAANHHRSSFQPLRIARVENPSGTKLGDIRLVDFMQTAEATSAVVPGIRRPVLACGTCQKVFCLHTQRRTRLSPRFLRGQPLRTRSEQEERDCCKFALHN